MLRILKNEKDLEGSVLVKRADCSWDELYELYDRELINLGADRLERFALHPVILDKGLYLIKNFADKQA